MVEAIWQHALDVLDAYRQGEDIEQTEKLYQHVDDTGILSTHKQWLSGRQGDIKVMFYELIRMIKGYQMDDNIDPDVYDRARAVNKIEGFQELTNQTQRVINQNVSNNMKKFDQRMLMLEKQQEVLTQNFNILGKNYSMLLSTVHELENEIISLKEKLNTQVEGKEFSESFSENRLELSNQTVDSFEDESMEVSTDIEKRLACLETGELYMQGSQRMVIERLQLGERYTDLLDQRLRLTEQADEIHTKQQNSVSDRILINKEVEQIKENLQDIENNREIHDRYFHVEEDIDVEEAVKITEDQKFPSIESHILQRNMKSIGQLVLDWNPESMIPKESRDVQENRLSINFDHQEQPDNQSMSNIEMDLSNIKRSLLRLYEEGYQSSRKISKIEKLLVKLFGENTSEFSLFELIDTVVDMNKSIEKLEKRFRGLKSQLQIVQINEDDEINSLAGGHNMAKEMKITIESKQIKYAQ